MSLAGLIKKRLGSASSNEATSKGQQRLFRSQREQQQQQQQQQPLKKGLLLRFGS